MAPIILSGVGGSTNWLPLVFPLVGIVIVLKTVELSVQFIKRKKLERENELIKGISASYEETNPPEAKGEQ